MTDEQSKLIESLYKEYHSKLFQTAYIKTRDIQLSNDIVNETFLIAVKKIDVLTEHPSKGGWLFATLYNKIKEQYKIKTITDPNTGLKIPIKIEYIENIDNYAEIADYQQSVDQDLLESESLDKYKSILKPKELEYIKSRFIDDKPTGAVAQELDITYSNATTMFSRIKEKIKNNFKKL